MWIRPPTAEKSACPVKCRGCGTFIIWCVTKAGANAPINIDYTILSTQKFGAVELFEIPKEASHFATCPNKDMFICRRR